MLKVTVNGAEGGETLVEVDASSTVVAVKAAVADTLSLDPNTFRLFVNQAAVEDAVELKELISPESDQLNMTLVLDSAPRDAEANRGIEDDKLAALHSALRWGKSEEEIEGVVASAGVDMAVALQAHDPKNGNQALHITAQNGHFGLTRYLLERRADVNGQNNKGLTPLHMSVEYDFYKQTKLLLEQGADGAVKNDDGNEAISGIDGTKLGAEAWDSPVNMIKSATTNEDLVEVLDLLEKYLVEPDETKPIDKSQLVMAGMAKKRTWPKGTWPLERWTNVVKSLP